MRANFGLSILQLEAHMNPEEHEWMVKPLWESHGDLSQGFY